MTSQFSTSDYQSCTPYLVPEIDYAENEMMDVSNLIQLQSVKFFFYIFPKCQALNFIIKMHLRIKTILVNCSVRRSIIF